MRLSKDYKVSIYDIDLTIPKGTRVTHQTAMGIDKSYHFVSDWSWYKPEVTGYARTMMLHDLHYRGVNVPKEYIEYDD